MPRHAIVRRGRDSLVSGVEVDETYLGRAEKGMRRRPTVSF